MKDFGKVVQGLGLYVLVVLTNMFLTGFIVWQLWTHFFPAADQPGYLSFVLGNMLYMNDYYIDSTNINWVIYNNYLSELS